MSDNINTMNFKQLKNEVQSLRDELAIMKRKYEDIIYNLDTDNFSQRVVKQGKDMYTKIEQNAESISLQAEKTNENSSNLAKLTITAEEIQSEVKALADEDTKLSTKIDQTAESIATNVSAINEEFKKYSTTEQTANQISAKVEEVKEYAEGYVTDQLANGDYITNATLKSQFDIYANGIYSEVSETYETKSDANSAYSSLSSSVSSIRQTANSISTRVGKVENGQFGDYTLFTQSNNTFKFDGKYMLINSAIQIADDYGKHSFSIFHNEGNGTSDGWRGTYIGAAGNNLTDPLFLGSSTQKVYLYDYGDDNLIATQGWVLENAGGVGTNYAIFG